jgi:hypothetical protein
MKAWVVTDKDSYEGGSAVVFAETRGKAKILARSTSACEDAEFTRITCRRMPDADKFYKGQDELSWYDEDARIFLVRDHGWECIDGRDSYCDDCPAKQYCGAWEDVGDDDY